jgi:hypothetical protein
MEFQPLVAEKWSKSGFTSGAARLTKNLYLAGRIDTIDLIKFSSTFLAEFLDITGDLKLDL